MRSAWLYGPCHVLRCFYISCLGYRGIIRIIYIYIFVGGRRMVDCEDKKNYIVESKI